MPLPRRHSLSTEDLAYFFKVRNKRLTFTYFYAYYKANTVGVLRMSVSLGKKRFSKATQRSKIKRLVYGAIMKVPNLSSYSFDVVVVPLSGIEGVAQEQLSGEFRKLFSYLK